MTVPVAATRTSFGPERRYDVAAHLDLEALFGEHGGDPCGAGAVGAILLTEHDARGGADLLDSTGGGPGRVNVGRPGQHRLPTIDGGDPGRAFHPVLNGEHRSVRAEQRLSSGNASGLW